MELFLFFIGGLMYYTLEVMWRGYSHWTMFMLGGICFVIIGLMNEHVFEWKLNFINQCVTSALMITLFELVVGCIVNIKLGWNVWDYSDVPFNFMGQICLPFSLLWVIVSSIVIIIDDWIRYGIYIIFKGTSMEFKEREKPHYILKW